MYQTRWMSSGTLETPDQAEPAQGPSPEDTITLAGTPHMHFCNYLNKSNIDSNEIINVPNISTWCTAS